MSYFAILHKTPVSINVELCHINLWQLDQADDRSFLFDIGIGFRVAEGSAEDAEKQLQVAIPFAADKATDIHPVLCDVTTASLVFGQRVAVDDGETGKVLSMGNRKLNLAVCHPEADPALSTGRGSVWNINPIPPASQEDCAYLRVRFRVPSGGLTWQSDEDGELLDLRVADTRGSSTEPSWDGLDQSFVSVPTLNAFVIVPASLIVRNSHPRFKYVRLLEGTAWSKYLAERAEGHPDKMIVYYGAHHCTRQRSADDAEKPTKPNSADNPFRPFLALGHSSEAHMKQDRKRLVVAASPVSAFVALWGPTVVARAWSVTAGAAGWLWEVSGKDFPRGTVAHRHIRLSARSRDHLSHWWPRPADQAQVSA